MVDTVASGIPVAAAKPPPPASTGRPQQFYADGSAVPDLIAEHHRPEDLDIEGILSLPDDSDGDSGFFGEDGLTFSDVLDIINPLQHIPVVSTLYRAITGDEISPGARVAGGAIFGGPIGAGVAIVNAAVEEATGEDIGETIMTALTGGDDVSDGPQVASAKTAEAAPEAIRAEDADPAVIGAGSQPSQQLRQAPLPEPAQPAAAAPQLTTPAPAALPVAAGQPFGGLGALPFTRLQDQSGNPVSAILQARSTVPSAGPVAGLGNSGQAAPAPQAGIPNISSRLADKLAALAGQPAPPERTDATPKDDKRRPENTRKPNDARQAGQPLPPGVIPQSMLTTLDRYQQMKKAEAAGISG